MSKKQRFKIAFLRAAGRFAGLIFLTATSLFAQVQVAPLQMTRLQLFNATGQPLAQGCVNFFAAGTSTPQAIYSDNTGTFQLPNPLTLDAAGSADVWLTNTAYRIVTYIGVPNTSCSTSLGTQLNVTDNKNIYAIVNQGGNFVIANAISDPSGVPGELGYRTDIPCLRIFTSIWDCVVTQVGTQILSNKTLTSPAITSPAITAGGSWAGSPSLTTPNISGVNAQAGATYIVAASDEQRLVTFSNASNISVTLPQATTSGFGAGTVFHFRNSSASGTVTITPTVSTIDGVASLSLTLGQGTDIYSDGVNYFSQKGSSPFPSVLYNTQGGLTSSSVGNSTLVLAGASGNTYRVTFNVIVGAVGLSCTGNSTLQIGLSYTDPFGGGTVSHVPVFAPSNGSVTFVQPFVITTNGAIGVAQSQAVTLPDIIIVKASSFVTYNSLYTPGTGCAPAPSYQITPIVELVK